MKFMVTFTGSKATHRASINKFLKEAASAQQLGFKVLGRWHGFGHGWMLIECSDMSAAYAYAVGWADVQDVTVEPVLDDHEAAAALATAMQVA